MSHDTDLLISVPRSCIAEFYNKYLNLVETFYYVTLTENKSARYKVKPEYVYFDVIFNLNPADGSFNPRELVGRIQVSDILFNPCNSITSAVYSLDIPKKTKRVLRIRLLN